MSTLEITQVGNFLRIGSWMLNMAHVTQIHLDCRFQDNSQNKPWVVIYLASPIEPRDDCPGKVEDWFDENRELAGQCIVFRDEMADAIRNHFGYVCSA